MKFLTRIILTTLTFSLLLACNNDPRTKIPTTGHFGAAMAEGSSLSVEQVVSALDTANEIPVKVEGTISDFCKGEGCWLTLKNSNGEDLLIDIKDKAFPLPYHIENKTAVVTGMAVKNEADSTLSVEATAIDIK